MTVHPNRTATLPKGMAEAASTAERRAAIGLRVMVVAVVVLQRFAVPGLTTALSMPIVLGVVIYLASERILVEDNLRTGLYLLAVGLCCGATLLSTSHFKDEWSLKSLLLLLFLYAPFCYRLRRELRHLYRPLLEFYTRIMVAAACVALAQWLAQVLGWTYKDPLAVLPGPLLLQTYNTFSPVQYGSSLMKTNAIVFLEPSFCSQFLALALITQLVLGGRRWRLALYAAAILTTVSGTGILLLGAGLVVLAVRRGVPWAVGMLIILVLLGTAVSLTSVGQLLTARSTEAANPNTSGNARFVAPYAQVSAGLAGDTATLLFGRGPGQSSPETSGIQYFNPEGMEANYPVIPKMGAEYGLIAALVFTIFAVVAMTKGTPSPTMSAVMLLFYFALSGSLLQPATVYTAYLFTSMFAAGPAYHEHRRPR
jgi:hypothetical protein